MRLYAPTPRTRSVSAGFGDRSPTTAPMRKVVAIRRGGISSEARYLSKNNSNLARLAAPPPPLRRGTFVVPFREPLQHAASMLRQHERFLKIHAEDGFVRRWMGRHGAETDRDRLLARVLDRGLSVRAPRVGTSNDSPLLRPRRLPSPNRPAATRIVRRLPDLWPGRRRRAVHGSAA